ncbi:MAG: (Fe-S)-binding protein [bacterium]|nr:(Fe-S)-binding protein [bacterium]
MTELKYWSDDYLDLSFANEIAEDVERLYTCIQCGSCTASCPTANRMTITPQRLSHLIQLGMREEVLESGSFWLCTSCHACATHCPRGIPVLENIIGLKTFALRNGLKVPTDVELLRQTIASTHNVSGDSNDDRLGWSTNLPQPLQSVERANGADILYFVGCVASFYPRAFSIPQAFGRILDQAGLRFTTLGGEEWCCGYPLYNAGLRDEMGSLVEHNLTLIRDLGVSRVVTACPSCYYTLKLLYPQFASVPSNLEILHSTQLLAELLDDNRIKPGIQSRVVTYHDPCDLGRKSGEYDAPRHILKSLPGVELREMANIRGAALCCGGGGDVKIFSHDTTMEVARRRALQALDIEADTIVSACQQCKRALVGAVQSMRQPTKVVDVSELVWESMHDKVEW